MDSHDQLAEAMGVEVPDFVDFEVFLGGSFFESDDHGKFLGTFHRLYVVKCLRQ